MLRSADGVVGISELLFVIWRIGKMVCVFFSS